MIVRALEEGLSCPVVTLITILTFLLTRPHPSHPHWRLTHCSAYYSVGEERPRVYRGSRAFGSDLFSSRFNTIASLRRHPQLIASENPPVSETAAEVLDEDRLKGGIS